MDVTFFVPGTTIPATTNAFGVVFSDANAVGNGTNLQFFDVNGQPIGFQGAPTTSGDGTFSFVGGFDNALAASIARVRITSGIGVVGTNEQGSNDIVVMDDFIYGEPLAVPPPPAPPTIGDIANQTVAFGSTVGPLAFTVADVETPVGQLSLSAVSSNPGFVANGSIAFGGSGANRTVIVNPTAGQSGTATITVTVTDGSGQTATDTFGVTVNAPVPPAVPPVAPATDLFAVATGPGTPVQVNVFEPNGRLRFRFQPFGGFAGGATVATGDVTGDGVDDVIVAAGPGGGSVVKGFDGATGGRTGQLPRLRRLQRRGVARRRGRERRRAGGPHHRHRGRANGGQGVQQRRPLAAGRVSPVRLRLQRRRVRRLSRNRGRSRRPPGSAHRGRPARRDRVNPVLVQELRDSPTRRG